MSNQIEIDNNIIKYLSTYSYKPNKVVDALITETKKLGEVAKMQISPEQGQFIELLVKITKAKNCLEIGRFTWLSTLFIAKGLQKNGKIFSVDNSNEFLNFAKRYWKMAKVDNKIVSIFEDGNIALKNFIDDKIYFDLIFIDADKNNYENYYNLSLKLLRKNGLILIDNVLWKGEVAKRKKSDSTSKFIDKLNKKIFSDKRVELSILPIADGLAFIRKK